MISKVIEKIFAVLVWLLPVSLVLGIIDYRFHNYYWPDLNFFRLLDGKYMFDFFSISEFFLLIFLIGYLILIIFSPENRPKIRWSWSFVPVVLMAFGVVVAFANFEGMEPLIKSFEDQVLTNYIFPITLFTALVLLVRTNEKWREELERSFLLTFSVFGGVILYEYFTDALPGENKDFLGRLVWPYIDPFVGMKAESANWLGFLFGPVVILGIIRIVKHKSFLDAIPTLIALSIILLSKSYTSILVCAGLAFIYLFLHFGRQGRKWLMICAVLAGAVLLATQYNTPKFQILIGQYDYSKPNSIERRVQIYEVTAESFKENWTVGLGPGNYQNYFREKMYDVLDSPIPEDELPPHPHNLALNFWSDLGVFGLVAILLIYLVTSWGVLTHQPYYFLLAYPLGHGLFDTPYGMEEVSVLFWIFLSLAVSHTVVKELNPTK